jgi:predicted thioesterase
MAEPDALATGLSATIDHAVSQSDTAQSLGSGDVPVLGTPRLLALAEAATVAALAGHLEADRTTVGTEVRLEHLRPSRVGTRLVIRADLVARSGRLLRFAITATDATGTLLGRGEVVRAIVRRARFLGPDSLA